MAYLSTMPTAFERKVRKLGLDERTCVGSRALRLWCQENKDRYSIPEWLTCKVGNDRESKPCAGPQRLGGLTK
jgi:hypothetical protein